MQNQISLTKKEHDVLRELQKDNTLTIAQLAQKVGVSNATISRIIKELKEKKLVGRVGASKNGKWQILQQNKS